MRRLVAVAVLVVSMSLALVAPGSAQAPLANEDPEPLQMHQARYAHTATPLSDGTVLVAGGSDGFSALGPAEVFDPRTREFRVVGSLSSPRFAHRAVPLEDGRVLLSGGMAEGPTVLDTVEMYQPESESFSPVGSLSTPRFSHAATLLDDGTILISGGHDRTRNEPLRSAEVFDPATGTTMPVGPMGEGRMGHAAALLEDGRVLLIGGHVGGSAGVRSMEVYEPEQQRFEAVPDLAVPVNRPDAVRLDDGRILVVSAHSALVSADATGSTRVKGRPQGRGPATVTLLDDGRAVAIGSKAEKPAPVYLFDPQADRFERLEPMRQPLADHRAVRLDDGMVLVVGGAACFGARDTAGIWDPITMSSIAGAERGCEQGPGPTPSPRSSPSPLGLVREGGRIKMPASAFAITIPKDWSVEVADPDTDVVEAEPGTAWEALRATAPDQAMACSVVVGVASVPLRDGASTGQGTEVASPHWDRKDPTLLWVPEPVVPGTMSSHQISWVRRPAKHDPDPWGMQYSLLCLANDREMGDPADVFTELFRSFKLLPLDR